MRHDVSADACRWSKLGSMLIREALLFHQIQVCILISSPTRARKERLNGASRFIYENTLSICMVDKVLLWKALLDPLLGQICARVLSFISLLAQRFKVHLRSAPFLQVHD